MRLLLTIIACSFLTTSFGQKKKLVASGTSSDLFITHKVSKKETYSSIARRYGVSSQTIADYNNLEYHTKGLSAKFLKVPLNGKNLLRPNQITNPQVYTAVYKKAPKNKTSLIGYLANSENKLVTNKKTEALQKSAPATQEETKRRSNNPDSLAATSKTSDVAVIEKVPNKTGIVDGSINRDSLALVKAGLQTDTNKIAVAPVTEIKKTNAPSKSWIKKKKVRPREPYGPGKFIKEFFASAIINATIAVFLIIVIYFYLSIKKNRYFTRQKLKKHIVKLISGAILHEDDDNQVKDLAFELPRMLSNQFHEKEIRQLLIDEIITAKKSFRGKGARNLTYLYEQLGLLKDSLSKLESRKWYVKTKGIQELALMDQSKSFYRIYRQTNSKNENVRMEAQSAIVHFAGFKGLRFLHRLTYPVSDWQQIKLIEQLSLLSAREIPDGKKLLQSKNNSVVVFALKIISVTRDLTLHDAVSGCLYYRYSYIRFHAIKCLCQIYDSTTAGLLQKFYPDENVKNKIAILEALKEIGTEEQTDFLYLELFNKNDKIKLAAAEALMGCSADALQLLRNVSSDKGYPYTNIFNHVKEGIPA